MSDHTPISRARNLRKNMTKEEKRLWKELRAKRFHGLKFLRQHPIIYQLYRNKPDYFIADFYCAKKKLVIEVDGKIHEFQKGYDQHRDEILNSLGLTVLRIKNEEFTDIFEVLKRIEEYI